MLLLPGLQVLLVIFKNTIRIFFYFIDYSEAQKHNTAAIASIRNFWSLFLNNEIKVTQFLEAAKEIDFAISKALATYKVWLLVINVRH
jgi:hypothetical protein